MRPPPRAPGPQAKADKIRKSEWWLSSMHVTSAWPSSRGSGVTVALLSTGVLTSHPDLTDSVTTGPDYTGSGETSASDTWGIEGTSAASIIAGHGDNIGDAAGIIGIAPAAKILSVRVAFDAADALNESATAVGRLPDAIAQGIRYAVAQGAKVIDLPLDPSTLASDGAATGGLSAAAGGSAAERSAVSYAVSKGVVLVAPAGDNGDDGNTSTFPASYPDVIAAGAVDQHGALAIFSTREPYVALTAPGSGVTAASRPSGYRNMSTTDAASAMVAGITALIRSRYPGLTSSQVRQALITGSARSAAAGTQAGAGAGTVDALKAMQAAAAIASPPPPTARPSAPATPKPAVVAPLTARPKPSTVGMAKSALRYAACAAGGLIVLLLGLLLGFRLWRRRSGQEPQSAAEPRTLLDAPSGPPSGPQPIQASSARHARAGEEFAFAPARPGPRRPRRPGPWRPPSRPCRSRPRPSVRPLAPGASIAARTRCRRASRPPAPCRWSQTSWTMRWDAPPIPRRPPTAPVTRPRAVAGPRKGRAGRAAAARTAAQEQAPAPGGPPWEPAPAPAPGDELLPGPWSRAPDPFSLAARPASVPPAPWDTSGRGPSVPPDQPELPHRGPGAGPAPTRSPPTRWRPVHSDSIRSGPVPSPGPSPGLLGLLHPRLGPPAAPATGPAAGERPPVAWRPIPPGPQPRPAIPAPPAGLSGPGMSTPTPPTGFPAVPASPAGPDPADDPGGPRPISPRDRLPLEEPADLRPAAPLAPPPAPAGPPPPWRIPGSSGRFPGAGQESPAPPASEPADPGSSRDGYPGRTGRLSRAGEFLPPYAGRPAPDDEPEPGPAPDGPPPAAEPAGGWTEESPSGPLYIWNPAALTEPFPSSSTPPAAPPTAPDPDDDAGPHHHRA